MRLRPHYPSLVRYDAMCRAIAAAFEVDEVKDIRDRAVALGVYARQAGNTDAERQAYEIRLRAERRFRELYDAGPKANGARGNPGGQGAAIVRSDDRTAQTLAELGVTKQQASDWKKLAGIAEEEFEAALAGPDRTSIAHAVEAAKPKPKPTITPVSRDALWLWGRLNDFKRDGFLDSEPADVLATMTGTMRNETIALAPIVSAWLSRIGGPSDA